MTARLIGQCCCGAEIVDSDITKLVVVTETVSLYTGGAYIYDRHPKEVRATLRLAREIGYSGGIEFLCNVDGVDTFVPGRHYREGFEFDVKHKEGYDEWKVGKLKFDNVQPVLSDDERSYGYNPETYKYETFYPPRRVLVGFRGRLALTINRDEIYHYWWNAGNSSANIRIPAGTYVAPDAVTKYYGSDKDKIEGVVE